MNFVKVRNKSNKLIYINIDAIDAIFEDKEGYGILIRSGKVCDVNEDNVKALIKRIMTKKEINNEIHCRR